MIQSRFFYSSLQEVQLNVKEIYSLQGALNKSIAKKLIKTARDDKGRPVNSEASPTSNPTTFAADHGLSTSLPIPTRIEIAPTPISNEELPKQPVVENQSQTRFKNQDTPVTGSKVKIEKIRVTKKTNLQSRNLPFWLVFLIWELIALLATAFFIL